LKLPQERKSKTKWKKFEIFLEVNITINVGMFWHSHRIMFINLFANHVFWNL
jgi:hypothetical protein